MHSCWSRLQRSAESETGRLGRCPSRCCSTIKSQVTIRQEQEALTQSCRHPAQQNWRVARSAPLAPLQRVPLQPPLWIHAPGQGLLLAAESVRAGQVGATCV
jgi:hypothetical protein